MNAHVIRCGILGACDQDLTVLSALHHQKDVEVAFVYDRDSQAVGIEIAEILGIARYTSPEQLGGLEQVDFVVVSEPRQRFTTEIEVLSGSGAKLINPADAIKRFGAATAPVSRKEEKNHRPRTMEDTLAAVERLLDRKELLKFLLDVAAEAAQANAGSIMLYSTETQDLYIGYALGLSERVINRTRQRLGSGIAGKVAQEKQPRLIRSADFSHMYDEDRERMDIGSAVCVPLFWGNQLLGVLNVSVSRSGRQLDENDLSKLKSLSRRISKVLFQSIKLEEAQLRHQEWRFRSTMGEIANKPITAQQKFTILSGYLAELVGAETVDIFLNTKEGDWFVLGGSNRVILPSDKRLRYQRGALSRSYLDNRCIVLTEGIDQNEDALAGVSSVIYCPLAPREASGVIALEFAERFRLDEFLLIKDAIILEVSRFLNAELREHKLTRELQLLRDVSAAAPAILGCRSLESLGETLGGLLSPILECERLSVRLRRGLDGGDYATVRIPASDDGAAGTWSDDEERFLSLAAERKIFSTAFLDFEPVVRDEAGTCRSVLAFPLEQDGHFLGGVIAYNKNSADPLEDAIFSEQDRKVVESAAALVVPVLTALLRNKTVETGDGRRAYQSVLEDNLRRLIRIGEAEIQRSDRYHHAFTLVLFRVRLLTTLFEDNPERALSLVEDMTRGLETRTRKTDFGTWIAPDTYAILTLEGGNRIRFLVGRVLTYLNKDLAHLEGFSPADKRILLGSAGYPGSAKTTEDLIAEATGNLGSHPQG